MYTITDTITGKTVTCEAYEIADSISPWFPQADDAAVDAEIRASISDLERVIRAEGLGGQHYEHEAFLGITVS